MPHCDGCPNHCSLASPGCPRGISKLDRMDLTPYIDYDDPDTRRLLAEDEARKKGVHKRKAYLNGKVYAGSQQLQEAFIVQDGRFTHVGPNQDILNWKTSEDEVVDLQGMFVSPGFIDSHMHMLSFGDFLGQANLAAHTASREDMLACLKDFAAAHPVKEGGWLTGFGWNQDYFAGDKTMPTRWDLDTVSTEVPIAVTRACGHIAVVNSKALELMGVTPDTPAPEGGAIGVTDGQLNGQFSDNALRFIEKAQPAADLETIKEMIRTSARTINTFGVTSVQSDDLATLPGVPWQTVIRAMQEVRNEGGLTVRVYEQSRLPSLEKLKEFKAAGYTTGIGDDLFRIGPLKILGDGSLGARTAWLSRPYADDPGTCGYGVFDTETLDALVSYANSHGMQIAIHAIGDACLDQVLDAYEKALAECPRIHHRHSIVHVQISRPEQLERIARLGLHVYAQSIFLDYDNHIVRQRVGDELAASSYSWKTLMNLGVSVSNGSDCPVELPDVLSGIQCAVTRTSKDGTGPYLPEQAFTVQEALDSYTIRGAEASFEERKKGQIRKGMLADFVILEGNPFATEPDRIKDIPVHATYLAGREVYHR